MQSRKRSSTGSAAVGIANEENTILLLRSFADTLIHGWEQAISRRRRYPEKHLVGRIGWLRAAVLGANDGIISTASLIVGVAAAAKQNDVLIAGVAGLVAGAMSMAAGEYVSVSSQSDTEKADLALERRELNEDPKAEHEELAEIYVRRGVDRTTAQQVARQLMAKDPLAAHARDELGISEITTARPVQAALTSAAMFFRGRDHAIADGSGLSDERACSDRLRRVPGLSRSAGSYRRQGRRCKHSARDDSSNVLGRPGPRYHRRNRQAFCNNSLKPRTSSGGDVSPQIDHRACPESVKSISVSASRRMTHRPGSIGSQRVKPRSSRAV